MCTIPLALRTVNFVRIALVLNVLCNLASVVKMNIGISQCVTLCSSSISSEHIQFCNCFGKISGNALPEPKSGSTMAMLLKWPLDKQACSRMKGVAVFWKNGCNLKLCKSKKNQGLTICQNVDKLMTCVMCTTLKNGPVDEKVCQVIPEGHTICAFISKNSSCVFTTYNEGPQRSAAVMSGNSGLNYHKPGDSILVDTSIIAKIIKTPSSKGKCPAGFCKACKKGELDGIVSISTVNCECPGKCVPIHEAARRGHNSDFDLLVGLGARLKSNRNGLLHTACRGGSVHIIKILVHLGMDVEKKGSVEDMTPMMLSIKWGKMDAFFYMLSIGCNVKALTSLQCNALHLACQGGNRAMVAQIFNMNISGVDLDSGDNTGWRPAHYAVESDSVETLAYIVGLGCNVTATNDDGETILHLAVDNANDMLVKYIISLDIKQLYRMKRRDGDTALMIAKQDSDDTISGYLEQAMKNT